MAFGLRDRWVWDFWFARRGPEHHMFYLQAPRSLGDPRLRHFNASIGHAMSTDLDRWTVLPDALVPGHPGEWDDLATWTGSVIERDGRWWMLYTGVCRDEGGLLQRVGLATSADLVHWDKDPANPVLEADPRWYELFDRDRWRDQSWRDPFMFLGHQDGQVHALLTARCAEGASDGAGAVAHARSDDLVHWDVLPPLCTPGEFAQMEVPQLVGGPDGPCTVLFSCLAEDHSPGRLERVGRALPSGTYCLTAPLFEGPYTVSDVPVVPGPELGVLYAGRAVRQPGGKWGFMGFLGDGDRSFAGEICGPLEASLDNGRFSVRALPPACPAVPAPAVG